MLHRVHHIAKLLSDPRRGGRKLVKIYGRICIYILALLHPQNSTIAALINIIITLLQPNKHVIKAKLFFIL